MTLRLTRRRFVVGSLAALAGVGVYGFAAEPRWLEESRVAVTLRKPPRAPVRILHLTDLHRSRFVGLSFLEQAFRRGLALEPDVICLTGDLVTAGDATAMDGYADVLRLLPARAPTYAVLGNHDGGVWSGARGGEGTFERATTLLDGAGVRLLRNRSEIVETSGGPLRLVGTGDLWSGDFDPAAAFDGAPSPAATPTVLLAHNPDTKDRVGAVDWDLMLSGHTHGGQVVVPWFGPPVVPVRDRRYMAGLVPWGDRMVYTCRGVGNLYGVRFNCRPEIAVLEVT